MTEDELLKKKTFSHRHRHMKQHHEAIEKKERTHVVYMKGRTFNKVGFRVGFLLVCRTKILDNQHHVKSVI